MEQEDSILLIEKPTDEVHVDLPLYYKEGFFSKDSLFHPELQGGRYGTMGDPIPYSVRGDDLITLLLLTSFVLAVVAYSNVRGFIMRQAKKFFYTPHDGATTVTETATEVRFQGFIVFLSSLMIATLFYFYSLHYYGDSYILHSQYYLILIFWVIILFYFLLKGLLYFVVNRVFFESKKNEQWAKSVLFIIAMEGILLFPAVIMAPYFGLPIQSVGIYFAIVLVFIKILTFYKCFVIFFRQNVFGLQIILYLCALEIVPLLALWGALDITANNLKINF